MVIGGVHATALRDEAARHADAVVVGEAEDTWPRVLDDAGRGRLEQVYVSTRRASLARMPAPRWDLIKGRRYGKSVTIATRGCPHRCDYCRDATNKAHNRVEDYRRIIATLHRHEIAVHLGGLCPCPVRQPSVVFMRTRGSSH